jgi:hypothetical protein
MTPQTRQRTSVPPALPSREHEPLPGAPAGPTRPTNGRLPVDGVPGRTPADAGGRPSNVAWMLLLPLVCCGGPVLIAAAASVGALGWGAIGAGIAVLIAAGLLIARRHAGRSCNAATGTKLQSPRTAPTPGRHPR